MTGPEGLLADPSRAPGLVVDASTVSMAVSSEIRDRRRRLRGVTLLAAPVSGNPKAARAGMLSVAVSGPREAYERALPYLQMLGRSVSYVGEGEAARLVKICHNLVLGVVAQILAETTVLAESGGVARADYLAFINDSVLGSIFTRYKTPAFVNLDYTPDLHQSPAAQGFRARARRRPAAQRPHAADSADRPDRRDPHRTGIRRAGLRGAARARRSRRQPRPHPGSPLRPRRARVPGRIRGRALNARGRLRDVSRRSGGMRR